MKLHLSRRTVLGGLAATSLVLPESAASQLRGQAAAPSPIGRAERMRRLARARELMQRRGIGAVLVEAGASLEYFTGVRWGRSERLTAAVIPAAGEPIIVTPFFEKPSIEESLGIQAEVRVWQEHEEPLKLVADFLRERGVAASPIGFEETNRFFILDRLKQQLPATAVVSANPVVRAARMIKSPAELALMQHAATITALALRETGAGVRLGMTNDEIGAAFERNVAALGGSSPWSLVLIDAAAALPHGSGKPQQVRRGSIILMDCGCAVHGYQSDISRTFVWGAPPMREQRRVWSQMRRGQDIAIAAAKVGTPAGAVDDAVRRAYESWGYGPGYKLPGLSHRTGHGIGMEGHEPINLVRGETTPLAPGMCFSNEPGIYLPGQFGVRLEDCFYMTAAGPKWFTVPPPSIDQPFA